MQRRRSHVLLTWLVAHISTHAFGCCPYIFPPLLLAPLAFAAADNGIAKRSSIFRLHLLPVPPPPSTCTTTAPPTSTHPTTTFGLIIAGHKARVVTLPFLQGVWQSGSNVSAHTTHDTRVKCECTHDTRHAGQM